MSRRRCCMAAAAGALLSLSSGPAAAATPPASLTLARTQLVESRGQVDPAAMALVRDHLGRPQAVFLDTTGQVPGGLGSATLRLGRSTGWSWQYDALAQVATRGGTPAGVELVALRHPGDDSLQILLVEPAAAATGDDRLRYLRRGGSSPALDEVIATGAVSQPRLAVDAAGNVHAAWLHAAGSDGQGLLRAARRMAGTWSSVGLGDPTARAPALAAHADASGAHLAWIEALSGGGNRVQSRFLPAAGPAGPVGTVVSATALTQVMDFALAAGPSPQLEVILVRSLDGNGSGVEHRTRTIDGWLCANQLPNCLLASFVAPHSIPAQGFVLAGNQRALALTGPEESLYRLPPGALVWRRELVAPQRLVAVTQGAGANDLPVALGPGPIDDPHRDLWLHEIGTQWRARRVSGDSNSLLHGALALAQDREGNPLLLGSFDAAGSAVRLLRWSPALNDFVAETVPGTGTLSAASLASVGPDGQIHAALRSDLGLLHAERDAGGGWSVQTVAAGNGEGEDPTMLRGPRGQLAIVYLDATRRPRIALRAATGSWQIGPMAEIAVPPGGRLRAAIGADGFLVHATFHDGQRLQRSTRSGDFTAGSSTLEMETLPHPFAPGSIVGETHALAALADGGFAVAYSARHPQTQAVRLGYLAVGSDGVVAGSDLGPGSPNGPIAELALVTGQGAGSTPRVLWAQADSPATPTLRRLYFAQGRLDGGTQEDFGALDAGLGARPLIALQGEGRITVGWVDGQTLWLARRNPALETAGAVPAEYSGTTQSLPDFRVYPICYCLLQQFLFGGPNLAACPVSPPGSAPGRGNGPLTDPLIFRLRQHFAGTPGGQYYLNLWTTHAREITTLTLAQPELLAQRWRTWADLGPGLEALVEGHGDDVRFTPDLVRATREVWLGWAGAAASPELRAAVEGELERLNQFEGFVGLGFNQWFQSLTPAGAPDRLLSDGFE